MDQSKPPHRTEDTASLFKTKIASAIEGGWMTMGLALGHATGLFGVMCQLDTWASSTEIAENGNFTERYVREWLYHMTSCGVIKMEEGLFLAPREHRKMLTRGPIKQSAFILGLSSPFPQIVKCFQNDGPTGLDVETVNRWLRFWENDRDIEHLVAEMLAQLPNELINQLERGAYCCDLGGGRGNLMFAFSLKYPRSKFISCDCSQSAIDDGKAEAKRRSVNTVAFAKEDVTNLPDQWTNEFDYVTMVQVLHNLSHPDKAIAEIFRILKPGGFLSVIGVRADSDPEMTISNKGTAHPPHVLYAVSLYYSLPTGLDLPSGAGLGVCPGQQKLVEIVKLGGFESVNMYDVADSCHIICSKPGKV